MINEIDPVLRKLYIPILASYNSRNGIFAVEIVSDVGFGAKLEWCLEIMAYCDAHGFQPRFRFSYPDSVDSEDCFASLLKLKSVSKEKPFEFTKIRTIRELGMDKDYDKVLNLGLAVRLIDKYLDINEDVAAEVRMFCSEHFKEKKVLGVHYRGTDKYKEAPPVSYDVVYRNIEHYLNLYPETDCVFIATDEVGFLDNINGRHMSRRVVYRNDSYRAQDGDPIHYSKCVSRYAINRDALVNCLILSKCDTVIKTASILSGWSKLFNPQLSLVILNKPHHPYFPERDLIKEVLYPPVE